MENTQRFCPGEGRCKFLHKYKISSAGGGEGGMEINSLVNLQVFLYFQNVYRGKTKQARLDDGIVVCLYLVQQKPYQHMFKQKYHKKWAKFLDSESSWRDLMFFVYVLSGTALDYHLYMYIATLHVGLFLPRLSLQDSVSLDVFS